MEKSDQLDFDPSPGDMKSLPRATHARRLGLSLKDGTVYKLQMFCLFIDLLTHTQTPIATTLVLDCSLSNPWIQ